MQLVSRPSAAFILPKAIARRVEKARPVQCFTGIIDLIGHDVLDVGSDLFLKLIAGGAESVELGVNRKRIFGANLILSPQVHFRSQNRLVVENGNKLGDYQDRRYGFRASLHYPLARLGRIELAYLWEHVDIDGDTAGFTQPSARDLAGLTAGLRFDTLDDADFPTSGLLGRLELERRSRHLGSDCSFSRSIMGLDHYFSLVLD